MSVSCDWLCGCQLAIVDKLSGRATLVQVIENVNAPRFPAQLPAFYVVATWHNALDMVAVARLRVRIDEAGQEPGNVLSDEEVTFNGKTSHRSICIVQSLTVMRPGPYRIVASRQLAGSDEWAEAAAFTFHVSPATPSGPAAQA